MSKISTNIKSSITRNILAVVFSIALTTLTVFGQAKTDADVRPLTIEKSVERELKGDEAHSYTLTLQAGQFLNVFVEQKGIDVVVSLFDADGKKIIEVDSPNGTQGAEPIAAIIETAGNYRLQVRSLEKSAAGKYEAKIIELRTATEKDKNQFAAEKMFAEGEVLRLQGKAESLRGAIKKYEEALSLYRAVGDKSGEANAMNHIGVIYSSLSENQKALDFMNQSLPIYRAIGDKLGEAATLGNIGSRYSVLGEKQKALDYFQLSLPLVRTVGDKSGEAITLSNIGAIYRDLGEKPKALEYYNQALLLHRAISDKAGEATTLNNIGFVYSDLGEKQKALEHFNQALPIYRAVGNKRLEAAILNNIGLIYSDLSDQQKALDYYNQALPLRRASGDKAGESRTLSNIGFVYNALGERQKALEFYNQSLTLSRAVKLKEQEAKTLNNIGLVYNALGDKPQALKYYNESLPLSRIVGDKQQEAATLRNTGTVYNDLGEQEKAFNYFQLSLPLSRSVGDKAGQARTFDWLMTYWKSLNNSRLAVLYGKQSVNLYQELRQNINALDKETQKTYLKSIEKTYRRLAEILIAQGRIPEAEQVLAMLKEEEYFQFVRRDDDLAAALDKRINLSPSEKDALERSDKIADELTQLGSEYAKLEKERNKPNITDENAKAILARQDAINEKLKDARIALDKFLEALKQEFSQQDKRVAAVEEGLQAEVKSWGDAQAVVISTIVGKENLSIIVTTPEIQTAHIVPISEEKINLLVGDFRAALTDPNSDPKLAAQKLYDVLIKPLEKDLSGARAQTLIWSLDGNLRYAPMAALWDKDKGYLIQRFANVVITLASRGNLAARPEGKKAWQALGVGVSKAVGGFQALSYVPEELDSIVSDSSIAPKSRRKSVLSGKLLLDEKFTSDAFRSNLGRYPIVHAATHFSFVSGVKDEALESFLLLGDGKKLTLAQIQNSGTIFNGVQLLALSACDTAYGGKDADGREIEGFGALAQKKGAKAVMATLWRVADESTRDLMIKFYGDYQKPNFTKAEALRQAQLTLLQEPDKAIGGRTVKTAIDLSQQFKHPYYWGSYILIGNWW